MLLTSKVISQSGGGGGGGGGFRGTPEDPPAHSPTGKCWKLIPATLRYATAVLVKYYDDFQITITSRWGSTNLINMKQTPN